MGLPRNPEGYEYPKKRRWFSVELDWRETTFRLILSFLVTVIVFLAIVGSTLLVAITLVLLVEQPIYFPFFISFCVVWFVIYRTGF